MDNQTEALWLTGVIPSDKGTGIFVFPTSSVGDFGNTDLQTTIPSEGNVPLTKGYVENINYPDCVQRGTKDWVLAFRWVPNSLETFDNLKMATCGTVMCVKRCARYGCVCIGSHCR